MTLAQVHDDADRSDVVFRHQVGDVLMFFLPGVISGLQKIATGDEKQGHKTVMVWEFVLSVIICGQLEIHLFSFSPVITVINLIHLQFSSL
jgi:hypothetical protein